MDKMSTSYVERLNLTMRHTVGRTRLLCLAFSKTIRGHSAAMALGVMAYNFTKIHSSIGMTPAMAARVADRPWTMTELVEAALAAEPVAPPEPVPLALHPDRVGSARELPNGRGRRRRGERWPLRALTGARTGACCADDPLAASATTAEPSGQLDLLAWRAPPPPPCRFAQLDLFGIEIESEK